MVGDDGAPLGLFGIGDATYVAPANRTESPSPRNACRMVTSGPASQ